MKLKKILAGAAAAALAVASLPQIVSAADGTLSWTYTAKTSETITVGAPVDEEDPTAGTKYEYYTVKIDLGFESEFGLDGERVAVVSDEGEPYYANGFVNVNTDEDGGHSITIQLDTKTKNLTAFLVCDSYKVATAKIDSSYFNSDKTAVFTQDNLQPVKFDHLSLDLTWFDVWVGDAFLCQVVPEWTDTVYLPVRDDYSYEFEYELKADSAPGSCYGERKPFAVSEGENTVRFVGDSAVGDKITFNLDASELPAYKNIVLDCYTTGAPYYDDYTYNSATVYTDRPTVNADYSLIRVTVNCASGDIIQYTLPDSLKDGDTVKLGTEFIGTVKFPYITYTYAAGSKYCLTYLFDSKDKYGNSDISLYVTEKAYVTVTFTNLNDKTKVYTEKTTAEGWALANYTVPVPEEEGEYEVELFVSYPDDQAPTTTPDTAPTEALTVEDKDTGIKVTGELPEGAALSVEEDKENSDEASVAFDITVTLDGKAVDIDGTVTVSIPVPERLEDAEKLYVFYKAEDGKLTDMKATEKDGVITFSTTHFSTYIVSATNLLANKDEGPKTGVALAVIPVIAAAAAAVISKKRK